MTVRTRFAPSPTGHLHVGGARTALFAWLYAKKHHGQFILRIEDTDRERSTDEAVDGIIAGMHWLGLNYDEGPFFQTKRMDRYRTVCQKLLADENAYYCHCSRERLENLRETQMQAKQKPRYDGKCRDLALAFAEGVSVVRFKNPLTGSVDFHDEVYGDICFANEELDDLIIERSDGTPTYNFTVVVDDWEMEITHVIRGDDHINNTPRQINILKALNAHIPQYAHLPMILGDDGKRLSKRHGAVSVLEFREMGILPKALINYIVRLGWSHGDQEIFSIAELMEQFTLDKISKGSSAFNTEKLLWLNQHYLKTENPNDVLLEFNWQLNKLQLDSKNGPELQDVIRLQADRCKTLKEMAEKSSYFYSEITEYNPDAAKTYLTPAAAVLLSKLIDGLVALPVWSVDAISALIKDICLNAEIKMPEIAQPVRVAVTGNLMSPSIDKTLFLLGREKTLLRLHNALEFVSKNT